MQLKHILWAVLALQGSLTSHVQAETSFPSKPITVVVPFSAGGATDVMARILSREASAQLGQPVVVENRTGAAGAIGAGIVARAVPDGYTVCICGGGPMVILKLLDPKQLSYDPARDLTPVTVSHLVDYVVGVGASSPYKSMRELVAAAKAKPGQMTYASTGTGGPAHLGQEYFNQLAGVEINHVPYKGENDFIPDLATGRVTVALISAQLAEQLSKSGKIRLLGTWSKQRLPLFPDLPTVAEQGWPSFEAGTFITIAAPKATPVAAIEKLNGAFVKALASPAVKTKMIEMGFTPVASSPAASVEFLHKEETKWGKVITGLGSKARE